MRVSSARQERLDRSPVPAATWWYSQRHPVARSLECLLQLLGPLAGGVTASVIQIPHRFDDHSLGQNG